MGGILLMRRSRFVSSVQTAEAAKPSLWEALWFDLRSPETSDDVALSEWRIGGLDHVAFLLGVTHLLIAITSAVLSPSLSYAQSLDNPLIPSVLVVVLDVMAASALLTRDRFNLAPHTIVRCLCLYIALVGLAWTWFGHGLGALYRRRVAGRRSLHRPFKPACIVAARVEIVGLRRADELDELLRRISRSGAEPERCAVPSSVE